MDKTMVKAHVFVDNSNIFGGAQRASKHFESQVPSLMVRVYLKNFFALIENGYRVITKEIAGSNPAGNDDLWKYATAFGYNIDLIRSVKSYEGRLVEQGVDELLHLKIANTLLDHDGYNLLILATGDGKVSEHGTGFVLQAERAIKKGWRVVIWSWKDQLSPNFKILGNKYEGMLDVKILDPYYASITYVKGGTFETRNGSIINVSQRVVKRLAGC